MLYNVVHVQCLIDTFIILKLLIIHLKKRKTWETDSYLYNYTPVWQRIFFKLRTLKKIQSALNLGPNQPSLQKIKVC